MEEDAALDIDVGDARDDALRCGLLARDSRRCGPGYLVAGGPATPRRPRRRPRDAEVVLEGDTIRIGEDDKVVVLKKAEWNLLVESITSGRLGRI